MHQLVRLEIDVLRVEQKDCLRLAKLRVLSIFVVFNETLRIDCPNLIAFETECIFSHFEFVHPDSIEYYTTSSYQQRVVGQFANLSDYWCRDCSDLKTGLLKLLPKLVRFHCGKNVRIELLNDLLLAKRKLRRLDFHITYAGLKIETQQDLAALPESEEGGFLFSAEESFEVLLENYDKMTSCILPHVQLIDWNALVANKHFSGPIDLDKFFGRFVDIQKVKLNGPITDKKQFVKFIRRCHLTELELYNGGLDQGFYNALPAYQPKLAALGISEQSHLNLEFLKDFFEIHCLFVNQVPVFYEFCCASDLPGLYAFCFITADRGFQVFQKTYHWNHLCCATNKIVVCKGRLSGQQSVESIDFSSKEHLRSFVKFLLFQLGE